VRGRLLGDVSHGDIESWLSGLDFVNETVILGTVLTSDGEFILGIGKYRIMEQDHGAELSLVVRDDYRNRGVGTEIISHLALIARREGLFYISAEALIENKPVLRLLDKCGLDTERNLGAGVYELKAYFHRE
jgi:GNAT superfamily N-acetyltransferase